MLTFTYVGGGVYRITNGRNYLGAISRSGKNYPFLPEPFVTFNSMELAEILEYVVRLEKAVADNT